MGSIGFQGFSVKIDDIDALNNSTETKRIGLEYQLNDGLLTGSANGNVSISYILFEELRRQLTSGNIISEVVTSSGKSLKYEISNYRVVEDDEDITHLIATFNQ